MARMTAEPRQKKSLSQVFLKFDWPVRKVVEKVHSWNATRVLEIGPGGGILTKALVEAGFNVTAVERDDRFVERLKEYQGTLGANPGGSLTVVAEDILRFDLSAWLATSNETTAVVGNIPYSISSPI